MEVNVVPFSLQNVFEAIKESTNSSFTCNHDVFVFITFLYFTY